MNTMRLGGPIFSNSQDPVELARAHRKAGYRAAYGPDDLRVGQTNRIMAFERAFADEDVVFAEVGAWCNMLDPRPEKSEASIQYMIDRLALADELGALCCVNTVGNIDPGSIWGPCRQNFSEETFDRSVEIARRIVDATKPRRAKLAYEMMSFNFLDTAENYLRFLMAIDRPGVGVHLDPVNCIASPRAYVDSHRVIEDCFRLLGPHIISCHAKDILIKPDVPSLILEEVRPGLGHVDYRALLRSVAALSRDVPVMLEHLPDEKEYAMAGVYIRGVAEEIGIAL